MENKPWLEIYNESYQDCIVGNHEGLVELKKAIDKALVQGNYRLPESLDSDFISIRATEIKPHEEEVPKSDKLIGLAVMSGLFIWGLALPIFAIYQLWQLFQ
jgi:hypothetical protein